MHGPGDHAISKNDACFINRRRGLRWQARGHCSPKWCKPACRLTRNRAACAARAPCPGVRER